MVKIRKANKKDFEEYYRLRLEELRDYSKLAGQKFILSEKQIKKEFEDIFLDKNRIIFVIDKEIKAFIIGRLIKNANQFNTYIDDIFVSRNGRRQGLGKMLINEFEKWSKLKKAKKITLGVRVNNKKAINLYKKRGYKITHYDMEKKI